MQRETQTHADNPRPWAKTEQTSWTAPSMLQKEKSKHIEGKNVDKSQSSVVKVLKREANSAH